MHILIKPTQLRPLIRRLAVVLTIFSLAVCSPTLVLADLVLVGDTNPVPGIIPDNAGDIMGILTIGDTDVGGLFMDLAPPLDGPLMDLESTEGIIGNEINGIGAVVFDDFGVRWLVETKLSVGNEGQGTLDLFDSALVRVGDGTSSIPETIIGEVSTGQGDVTVNGVGTLLDAGNLVVGKAGFGTISVNSRATLRSRITMIGSSTIDPEDDLGDGLVTLTDRGTRWAVREALTVGGLSGSSRGKIEIQNEALLQIEGTNTGLEGTLTVNPRGTIELAGGTIRMLPQGSNFITNNGLIQGDGFIDGGINIGVSGELRNAAGLANAREYLLVSEAVENNGLIESIGGEMEFQQRVTSTGDIVGRDAILRFRGSEAGGSPSPDLAVNGGTLQLGGDTTVYGDVNVDVGGGASLTIFGGGAVVFVDGLSFGPAPAPFPVSGLAASTSPEAATTPATFSVTLGESPALEIGGMLDLGTGLTLDVIYDGLQPSMENDVLTVLTAGGGITGTFTNTELIADGRVWDIDYLPIGGGPFNEVIITALGIAQDLTGDFDFDRDVDGNDFLTWQRGPADAAGLADWEANFGRSGPGPLSAVTAVPEPSTLALVLLSLVCCPRRRSQV